MTQNPVNKNLVQAMHGASADAVLTRDKARLALVQAACLMSLEGTTRATASQVADRAAREFRVAVTPALTGQVFSTLGIPTVTIHGKSRFVLDGAQLDKIRQDVSAYCAEQAKKLAAAVTALHDLPDRIEALQKEWSGIRQMRAKEQQLIAAINEARSKPSRLPYLESEAARIRQEAATVVQLETECQELTQRLKQQPSLEQRKAALQNQIAAYNQEERHLIAQEERLAEIIEAMKPRKGIVDLAILQQNILQSKAELEQLSRQLGEKRSLLDRILQRGKPEIRQ